MPDPAEGAASRAGSELLRRAEVLRARRGAPAIAADELRAFNQRSELLQVNPAAAAGHRAQLAVVGSRTPGVISCATTAPTRTPVAASAGRPPPRPSPPLHTRHPKRQRYPTDCTAPQSGREKAQTCRPVIRPQALTQPQALTSPWGPATVGLPRPRAARAGASAPPPQTRREPCRARPEKEVPIPACGPQRSQITRIAITPHP